MDSRSFSAWMQRLWVAWDIRVMVLISLTLQIILIILGSRRKYVTGLWIRIIVWSAYLMADSVATIALGKLSTEIATEGRHSENNNNYSPNPHHVIRVLWAPVLLLHLGGPDTITAYSVEDNQLWKRHALGLAVQVGVVIYIFLRCWTGSWLSILTFPMFAAGIIKYGERVWVLWSTNNEQPPENEVSKDDQGTLIFRLLSGYGQDTRRIKDIPGLELLLRGFFCFYSSKPHIANYVCSYQDSDRIFSVTDEKSEENIFKVIEFELGFMYDVLYTKAAIIYTMAGCILRSISFFCTVSVLVGFSIITKDEYSNVDEFITYLLLVGAVVLDIYALTLIPYSDWAILWMTRNHKSPLVSRILRFLAPLSLKKWKRWSDSMAQFNLLKFCLYNDKPTLFSRILKVFGMDEMFREYWCQTRVNITKELKELTVDQIGEILIQFLELQAVTLTKRGEWSLKRYNHLQDFEWSVQVDFDLSIIIWHIATDICYYLESDEPTKSENETSKLVSDYMMYLLVERPHMLSITTWHFMFKHTCTNIKKIFQETGSSLTDKAQACRNFLREESLGVKPEPSSKRESKPLQELMPARRRSAVMDARRLANTLLEKPDRWKIISGVWIEMLCYAATHCQVNHHAQELRRGGEFLTHVWLLLTNYGLTEKFNKTALRVEELA